MPNYSKHGKIRDSLSYEEFFKLAEKIKDKHHKAYAILSFYTGLRVTEIIRVVKEQFKVKDEVLIFDVGPRLKTRHKTDPLEIPVSLPGVDVLLHVIRYTRKGERVFRFNRVTAWRICSKHFNVYPHYFRLNRITQFLMKFSIPEVSSWSGHTSLAGINAYLGRVNIKKLGESLKTE